MSTEETVQLLLSAIQKDQNLGSRIYIGFVFYDARTEWNMEEEVIRLAQFRSEIYHSCVWFSEHVTSLAAGVEVVWNWALRWSRAR